MHIIYSMESSISILYYSTYRNVGVQSIYSVKYVCMMYLRSMSSSTSTPANRLGMDNMRYHVCKEGERASREILIHCISYYILYVRLLHSISMVLSPDIHHLKTS